MKLNFKTVLLIEMLQLAATAPLTVYFVQSVQYQQSECQLTWEHLLIFFAVKKDKTRLS